MYQIAKELYFCFGHRIVGHAGKCRNLHGHNVRAIFILESRTLDEFGMVYDFADVKEKLEPWIDKHLDHKMILCNDDPYLPELERMGVEIFVMDEQPSAENLAKLLYEQAKALKMPVKEVRIFENPTSQASWRSMD